GSTGSRPSSGSRPGSGSRSGSRGRNNQFRAPAKNGNREGSLDILGTDIWAANTLDSHGGATWDLQPEKLDFSQFHRKPFRGTPKHLPHIDREGMTKGKFEDDDGIDLNDMEKFLPGLTAFPSLSNEAEIAHTKKLFRRRRNDRRHAHLSQDQLTVVLSAEGKRHVTRRQQRLPGGSKSQNAQQQQSPQQQQQQQHPPPQQQQQQQQVQQQNTEHLTGNAKHAREHGRQFQGQGPHPSGRQGPAHHGYSQNRRWHHNQKHQAAMGASPGPVGEKGASRNTKETENVKAEEPAPPRLDPSPDKRQVPGEGPNSSSSVEDKPRDSNPDPGPKVSLLQSSKERLRRRLKEKDEVPVAIANPQRNRMDKLMEILNSMRNNSSEVDGQLTTFMEEAQDSANSEEMLSEIVRTIYRKAVGDRSFASTAAKLCDKMALFMVEGTNFRSLLLNMLEKDFRRRDELQQSDVERWLGFITFLCEVFGIMRSSAGSPSGCWSVPSTPVSGSCWSLQK
ncbi:hypothetical protein AAFF_G00368580, partial [Aldrovandia affinis]